jgi:DNA sulfur modification protein DndD
MKNVFLHDLTISEFENIKNFLKQSSQKVTNDLEELLHERQKNSLKIDRIKKEIRHIPNDNFILLNLEKISKLKSENESLNKTLFDIEEKISSLTPEIQSIQKSIEEFEENIVCIDEDGQKIDLINRVDAAVNEYIKEMVTLNIKNLESTISTMYRDLANKEDMIKEIKVDPYTFTTELFDYDGNQIKKEGISEGEKEIYAISVLWGLSRLSPHKLPMIIDTPLAKLDTKHVANITSKFFPNASEQVILLSQDREIDQNIYSLIKPHLNQSYTLMQTEENKIKSGYFFK